MELKELTERLLELSRKVVNTNITEYKNIWEVHAYSPRGTYSPSNYYDELTYIISRISKELNRIVSINVLDYSWNIKEIEYRVLDIEKDYDSILDKYHSDLEVMINYEDED